MNFNRKSIVSGFALLLFGIIAAINQSLLSYISGGLGLFIVLAGCIGKDVE